MIMIHKIGKGCMNLERKKNVIPFNPERRRSTSIHKRKHTTKKKNQSAEKMTFWDRVGIFITEIIETIIIPFALLVVFLSWIASLVKKLVHWISK